MLKVARFLEGYLRHPHRSVRREEVTWEQDGGAYEGTLFRPAGRGPFSATIALHGITVPGRHHPVLVRFASAVARAGSAVLLPDVPEWRRLELDHGAGDRAIAASVAYLQDQSFVKGKSNLIGFSFGATQALTSSTLPGIREHVDSVTSFGGYCSLARTMVFMVTGEHEWKGEIRRLEPDPYGRWIVVANYLRHVPEYAHLERVAEFTAQLAAEAGRVGAFAGDPRYDPLKAQLRAKLNADERALWDLVAPPTGVSPPEEEGRKFAEKLVDAAVRVDPHAEPLDVLREVTAQTVLAHGRADQLIPFTETLRLREALPEAANARVTITRLFSHSQKAARLRAGQYAGEFARYLALLNRALRS